MGCQTTEKHTLTESQSLRWLKLQAGVLGTATRGCLYISPRTTPASAGPRKTYFWPAERQSTSHFHQVCRRAEKEGKGVILSFQDREKTGKHTENCVHIALPLTLGDDSLLVSAFELYPKDKTQLHQWMQRLEWGLQWLREELLTCSSREAGNRSELHTLLSIHTAVLEETTFATAAHQLTDDLARLLSCERVSVGLYKKQQMEVVAISSQSRLDKTSPLVRDIAHAMEECHDQQEQISYPSPEQSPGPISKLHELLAVKYGCSSVISLPLGGGTKQTAMTLLLERTSAKSLTGDQQQYVQYIEKFIGPSLIHKLQQEYSLTQIISTKVRDFYRGLRRKRGAERFKVSVILLLLLFFVFARGDFRVEADVSLSGTIVRAIIAPFPGYLADAEKSAGDYAEQGEVLAAMDTSDLNLEEITWKSKYTQADLEYRKAVADNATSQAKIIDQQKKQAQIQLSLLHLQQERAEIRAPFTGIIVTGDLSQAIGGPVERGKLLFEMVPDGGFKILAQVDEKDINFIKKEQTGLLIFNSLPKEKFQFSISKITPVSTAADGRNSFRVEASLQDTSERLRPGMKGYGKIIVGRKPLVWIWTRSLRNKIRLLGWKLLP